MVKTHEADYSESEVRFTLPTTEFDFQSLSRKVGVDVCRFDGVTYLYNPALKRGKKYEEVYILAMVNGEKVVQKLDYDFLTTIRLFLKEMKDAGKPVDLFNYKLHVTVERSQAGEYEKSTYSFASHTDIPEAELPVIPEGTTYLAEKVGEIEARYREATDMYLQNPPAPVSTEEKKEDKLPF